MLAPLSIAATFQTKLTYGMICYDKMKKFTYSVFQFQTKLTYGMICYLNGSLLDLNSAQVSN